MVRWSWNERHARASRRCALASLRLATVGATIDRGFHLAYERRDRQKLTRTNHMFDERLRLICGKTTILLDGIVGKNLHVALQWAPSGDDQKQPPGSRTA
jgi:hypothetical protein